MGYEAVTSVTGIITAGTRDVYGFISLPSAGAESTGGTTNVYGYYAQASADVGAGGTVNGYGLYVANGTFDTDGTSTQYGLYVETPTGADSNYAGVFAGGNVGIGTTTPSTFKLEVAGSIGPSADDTYDLGSNTRRFQDLYLGPATLHIGTSTSDEYKLTYDTTNNTIELQAAVDAVEGFQVLDTDGGTPILNVDTTNGRLGIGTAAPAGLLQVTQATTGTGTVATNGTTTLTGTSTQFLNTFKVGDTITVSGETIRTIATIASNTSLTVTVAFSTTASSLSYTLTGGDRLTVLGNSNVGIGTTSPDHRLKVVASGSDDGVGISVHSDTANVSGNTNYERSRGTIGSPTAVSAGDEIGQMIFKAYNNGAYRNSSWILGAVDSVGATEVGGRIVFSTSNGTSAPTEKVRITGGGDVGIGTGGATPFSKLDVTNASTSTALGGNAMLSLVNTQGSDTSNYRTGLNLRFNNGVSNSNNYIEAVNQTGGAADIIIAPATAGAGTERLRVKNTGTIQFNAYGAGTLVTDASGNITASSDERLKDVQGNFSRGLDDILNLDPILYKWNDVSGMETDGTYAGFSAQDVQGAIPEAVSSDSRGYLTLQDRPILATSINAIKEMNTRLADIEALTSQNPSFASLNVSGQSTLDKLTVAEVTITASLRVEGRWISVGDAPIVNTGIVLGANSSASISGTPNSGVLTLTSGTDSLSSGELLRIILPDNYVNQPNIVFTASNQQGASLRIYYTYDQNTKTISLNTLDTPTPNTTYKFSYIMIESAPHSP